MLERKRSPSISLDCGYDCGAKVVKITLLAIPEPIHVGRARGPHFFVCRVPRLKGQNGPATKSGSRKSWLRSQGKSLFSGGGRLNRRGIKGRAEEYGGRLETLCQQQLDDREAR